MTNETINRRCIYVAASDESLIRALAEHRLQQAGWCFAPPRGPLEPDALVILDFDDKAERLDWIGRLRAEGFAGPVLILGGVDGAESTDDEPIVRPVRLGTLLARIDAHAAEPNEAGSCRLGPYEFVPADRELRLPGGGEAIRLTELERKLLACLAEADGAMIEREQLLARVWGYSAGVATHTVETHVWRLRQKIETDDPATHFLVTEPGGYRVVPAAASTDSGPDLGPESG